ncbi:MAG TPA: Co2+/Mg2+ efflux protein ApaG [Vicinamibacterales bacterium]|nr:Co2+/Mg2+ efflux protein ApaG [Vicinamibacterales bacterium]
MTDTTLRRVRTGIRTSDATTRGIRVEVQSEFLPDRSSLRDGSYFFQYHVRISNIGSEVTQLISREWIITNADGEVERVRGLGVVGEQPVLPPGGSFEYTSFSDLKTAVGSMQGSYQMVTSSGERFDAVIAPFTLAMPNALN